MKSYLKFLSRNKLYTAIEFIGLAVSLAFVILIGTYVVQQYDVAHEGPAWKRTFTLGSDEMLGLTYWDKEELQMNIPEVEAATHLFLLWQPVIQNGEDVFQVSGVEADGDFFSVFPQYHIIEGNVRDFVGKSDILISQSLARRLSTDGESLVGKVITMNESTHTIKAVYADFEGSFIMPFDVITNIEDSWMASGPKAFNSIGGYSTWFRIWEDADPDAVREKVKDLLHKNYDANWTAEKVNAWRVYRLDEAFFFNDGGDAITRKGSRQMLSLLTVVVLLLLLSAIFNYVNLSLALTGKRAKEMATRRLLGAERKAILWKYIGESVAFSAVCFAAALLLADIFAPMLNALVSTSDPDLSRIGIDDTSVRLSFMMTPGYIAVYILGILLLGTICGLLPAFSASRFEPIDIIKGEYRRRSKMTLSRVFIVVQNVLAVFLIAVALVMEVQMRHMLTRPSHSAVDNRYYIEYSSRDYDMMKLFKDKVDALPFVTASGVGRGIPGMVNLSIGIKTGEELQMQMPVILCDSAYFRLLGLEVEEDFGHPFVHSLWMSRSAFSAAGASDTTTVFPRRINVNGARPEFIGGVVTDFPTRPASESSQNPNGSVVVVRTEELQYANCLLIGTTGEDPSYDKAIRAAYSEYSIEQNGVEEPAWSYGCLRDLSRMQLEPVRRTLRLVELFALLSVLIALLGLLAMSTYFADENAKQIAVRKVFGADVSREIWRNVKSYMLLVGIACIIGIPLAVWASGVYLSRFAYRIFGYGWIFAVAVLITLTIAFGTVLWQVVRSARANPAIELKKE